MAQKELTAADLKSLINTEVQDVLKGQGLSSILEPVQAQIEKASAPLREQTTDWGARIIGALGEKTETPKRERGLAFGRVVRAVARDAAA